MKLTKDDLNGSSSGSSEDVNPQKVVDQNLSAQSAAGGSGMKDIMAEVRQTVQEFNGLAQELKKNPAVAKAIASQGGGNSFQAGENPEEGQREGGNMSIDAQTAYNLFLNGMNAVKDKLGDDATLQEATEFLQENEEIVKIQVKQNL